MRTLLKAVTALLVLVIVVPLLALVVITRLIDPNDYKAEVEALVAQHTRGTLALEGDLAWSFFPTLGFSTGALQFRLPEDGPEAFARLQGAHLGVRLLPLLQGSVAADTVTFEGLTLQLAVDSKGRGNWTRIAREDSTPAPAATTPATSGGAALALTVNRIVLSDAHIHYTDRQSGSRYAADPLNLSVSDVNLDGRPVGIDLSGTLAGTPFGQQRVPLSLQARLGYEADKGWLQLEGLVLELANLAITADLLIHPATPLEISGSLAVKPFSVPALLQALGQSAPALQDPQALSRVALQATFAGPPNGIVLNPLVLTLDDTVLQGQAGITPLDKKRLLLELRGNRLDIDRYMAAATDTGTTGPAKAPTASDTNAALLPLAALRQLDFSLKLALDALVANGITVGELQLTARGAGGLLTLERLDGTLYGGKLRSTASLDAGKDVPPLRFNATLDAVQIGPLLQDMQGSRPFDGIASLTAELQTRGNSVAALKRNLSGPASLLLRDGILHGVSLEQYTCQAIALSRKQKSSAQWPQQTAIERVAMNLLFNNGVGVTQDFKGKLAQLRLLGEGAVSLPDDRFDIRLGVVLAGDLSGTDPACAVNETYRDIAWPLRCQGRYAGEAAKTECGVDSSRMGELLEKMAKKEAKRAITEKADEKLGGALKGLFGK